MIAAETFVIFASEPWTRPFTLAVMLAADQSGLFTCLSTSVDPLVVFRCLWSQETLLSSWDVRCWNTSRFRLTMLQTRSPSMAVLGLQPLRGDVKSTWSTSTVAAMIGVSLGLLISWLMTPLTTSITNLTMTPSTWKSTSTSVNCHLQSSPSSQMITCTSTSTTFNLHLYHNFTWTWMKTPIASSGPSPTSCWNRWLCINMLRRSPGSELLIASFTSMTRVWSSSGRSMQAKAISAVQCQTLAMKSPPLTWLPAGTSQRDTTGVSSSNYFVKYVLTSCGWLLPALCGAHFRVWLQGLRNSFMHFSARESTRNTSTWSSPPVCSWSKIARSEMLVLNNLSELCPGEQGLLKVWPHRVIWPISTNVPMELCCLMIKASWRLYANLPLCAWRALHWLTNFHGNALEDIAIYPLKEARQELEIEPKPQQPINLRCASILQPPLTTTSTTNTSKPPIQ